MIDEDERDRYPYLPGFAPGSETSEAAAESIEKDVGRLQRMVLDYITAMMGTGATDWELECALNLRHQTASARRRELQLKGWVKDSGRTRPTDSGRKAVVWVLTTRED